MACVLFLLMVTIHSSAQSEILFMASCILMFAVLMCSEDVHIARSSAWMAYEDMEQYKDGWLMKVKQELNELGLCYIWNVPNVDSIVYTVIKERIII